MLVGTVAARPSAVFLAVLTRTKSTVLTASASSEDCVEDEPVLLASLAVRDCPLPDVGVEYRTARGISIVTSVKGERRRALLVAVVARRKIPRGIFTNKCDTASADIGERSSRVARTVVATVSAGIEDHGILVSDGSPAFAFNP